MLSVAFAPEAIKHKSTEIHYNSASTKKFNQNVMNNKIFLRRITHSINSALYVLLKGIWRTSLLNYLVQGAMCKRNQPLATLFSDYQELICDWWRLINFAGWQIHTKVHYSWSWAHDLVEIKFTKQARTARTKKEEVRHTLSNLLSIDNNVCLLCNFNKEMIIWTVIKACNSKCLFLKK